MSQYILALLLTMQPQTEDVLLRVVVAPAETLRVSVSGRGAPIVYVPGMLGGAYGFRKVAALLDSAGFRTLAIEPLGTGGSSRPKRSDYSLDAQAERIATVMDSLALSGAGVVAHAIGGSIALRLASRRPDLVGSLLLLEAGPAESASTAGLRRAMKLAPLLKLLGAGSTRGRVRAKMVEASGDPGWVEPATVAAYVGDASGDMLDVLRAVSASREREPLAPRLSRVRAPTLLLIGGAPHSGGPDSTEITLLAGSIPDFDADTLNGVGHFLQEEAPDLVRDAIVRLDRRTPRLADRSPSR